MALTPSGDRIQWKESLQGFKGSQVARKGQTWTKRAKKAFLDHIIDQKRLIKGFQLKIGNKKNKKMKAQHKYSQEKVTTGVQGVTSGQKGSKRAKRAKKAFLDHIIDQKRLIKGFRLKISKIKLQK